MGLSSATSTLRPASTRVESRASERSQADYDDLVFECRRLLVDSDAARARLGRGERRVLPVDDLSVDAHERRAVDLEVEVRRADRARLLQVGVERLAGDGRVVGLGEGAER